MLVPQRAILMPSINVQQRTLLVESSGEYSPLWGTLLGRSGLRFILIAT